MEGFSQEQDMVQVPLHVIEQWTGLSCPGQKIWIVQKLKKYYNGIFHYWHMEAEDCRGGYVWRTIVGNALAEPVWHHRSSPSAGG